jgi:hypothetical protein
MPNYENETCEGCVMLFNDIEREGEWQCHHPNGGYSVSPFPSEHCDGFTPSLECRKVRALEKLATSMGDDATISIRDYGAV